MTTPDIRNLRRNRARQSARWPTWIRLLIALAGLYVLYIIFGYAFAPGIIKSQIEKRGSAQLQRPVTVEKVVFNPFIFTLALEGVHVKDRDGKPLVDWKRLYVNLQFLALVRSEIHLSVIELDGFSTRLSVSKSGILNIADLLDGPKAPPPAQPSNAWSLRIDRLSVNAAQIDYADDSRAEPFHTHVGPTTFVLRDFRTAGGRGAPGLFTAATEAGETVSWTGNVALSPLRSNGEIRLGQIAIKKYGPYYDSLVPFDVLNGLVDVQVPYEFFIQDNKPEIKITDASVHVHDLALADRTEKKTFFSLSTFDIDPIAADLLARSVDVGKIALVGGQLNVERASDGINLLKLMPPASANSVVPASATNGPAEAPFTVKLAQVAGKNFAVKLEDRTTTQAATIQLRDVSFSAQPISSANLAAPIAVEFHAQIEQGKGNLSFAGQLAPQPLKASLNFTAADVQLATFSPWIETLVKGRLTQGVAQTHGQVRFGNGAKDIEVTAIADADVTNVALTDAAGNALAAWKSLGVHGVDYSSAPDRLAVTEISWVEPVLSVTMGKDHVLNVSTLMGKAPVKSTASPAPPTLGPPVQHFMSIDRFSLENANLAFVDQSIDPEVKSAVSQFSGTITGLTSAAIDRGEINFKGLVDGAAPLVIGGTANVLSDDLSADLKISIQNSNLLPLGPYVGRFVGYNLSSGGLSLETRAKLALRKLDSTSNVVVTDFALGDATNSPEAPHVPVRLALALLRDSQGRIVLDIPVQGSLDDPKFQIGDVVWKLVKNLIIKAATSPFSLIGSAFGGGHAGNELAFQDFAPGSSELDAQSTHKLDVMAHALHERPGLHLVVLGNSSPAADLPAIREQVFTHRLQTAIFEEGHTIDPTMTSADQVTVSAGAEARLIGKWYEEQFMQPAAASVPPPPPPEAPKRRFFLVRWIEGKKASEPVADKPAPKKAKAKSNSKKPEPKSTDPRPPAPTLPPLAEMRERVLAALPVSPTVLPDLAKQRAEHVQQYIIQKGEITPDRVTVENPPTPKPATRVNLELR